MYMNYADLRYLKRNFVLLQKELSTGMLSCLRKVSAVETIFGKVVDLPPSGLVK